MIDSLIKDVQEAETLADALAASVTLGLVQLLYPPAMVYVAVRSVEHAAGQPGPTD